MLKNHYYRSQTGSNLVRIPLCARRFSAKRELDGLWRMHMATSRRKMILTTERAKHVLSNAEGSTKFLIENIRTLRDLRDLRGENF
jgi:hypothetical protein